MLPILPRPTRPSSDRETQQLSARPAGYSAAGGDPPLHQTHRQVSRFASSLTLARPEVLKQGVVLEALWALAHSQPPFPCFVGETRALFSIQLQREPQTQPEPQGRASARPASKCTEGHTGSRQSTGGQGWCGGDPALVTLGRNLSLSLPCPTSSQTQTGRDEGLEGWRGPEETVNKRVPCQEQNWPQLWQRVWDGDRGFFPG